VIADVSSHLQVKGMVDSTVKGLGGLDMVSWSHLRLLSKTANSDARATLWKTVMECACFDPVYTDASIPLTLLPAASITDLEHIFSVNVPGVFLCYKYAALQMVEQGRGGMHALRMVNKEVCQLFDW
jgi:NAD(P)-dependent dehydrogenase (short-subunit alcohol dehydrogenase family)